MRAEYPPNEYGSSFYAAANTCRKRVKYPRIAMVLSLAISGTLCGAIYFQPYLQNPQPDGMTILWWTDANEPASTVLYGPGNFDNAAVASNEYISVMYLWRHEAVITNLATQTEYDYKVVSGGSESNSYTFKTAPLRDSDFHLAVLGDGRTDDDEVIARHRHIVDLADQYGADLVFETGDMVYRSRAEHWNYFFRRIITASDDLDPGSDLASRVPYQTVIGNHEIYESGVGYAGGNLDTALVRYKALFSNPANNANDPNWIERYYPIRYGCAAFIVLDTNNDLTTSGYDNHDYLGDFDTPPWSPGTEQYAWMVNQLEQARSDCVFTFVLFHPSPYCRGVHGDPNEPQSGFQIRALEPVFRSYGVDAVFTSHDHLVEHCLTGPNGFHLRMDVTDPNNLNWFVQGNAGHTSRPAAPGWISWMDIFDNNSDPNYTVYFYDWYGDDTSSSFLDVDIRYQGFGIWQATLQTVRSDGNVYDVCTLTREDPLYVPQCGDRDHPYPVGDLNRDCRINVLDLDSLLMNWSRTDCADPDRCSGADLVQDGRVNLLDFSALTQYWLRNSNP
jgi:hypothetical protein